MPCLEVTLPECERSVKAALADALTTAMTETTGHDRSIFSVAFHELRAGQSALAGKLDGGPYLHVVLYVTKLAREQKQTLVARFTAAIESAFHRAPVVHIVEHTRDDVGVEGKLLSDLFPK